MRGKLKLRNLLVLDFGITPAHAGKTAQARTSPWFARDHPRACGENLFRPETQRSLRGSPPRMRGKRCVLFNHDRDYGITPAHAGKTRWKRRKRRSRRDHPRACGENTTSPFMIASVVGSPPRMRGKLFDILECQSLKGITPAHAGKTCPLRCSFLCPRDHPRACGENW